MIENWLHLFPSTLERHLLSTKSDHCPLLFMVAKQDVKSVPGNNPFRFENIWLKYNSCEYVIRDA